jgi:Protein of unknown function (DUF3592)
MGSTILLFLGIATLIAGLLMFENIFTRAKSGVQTTAIVIEIERIADNEGVAYKPTFSFRTSDNKEVIVKHYLSSNPSYYQIGETVPIIYDAKNPTSIILPSFVGRYFWPIILISIAIIAFVLSVCSLLV